MRWDPTQYLRFADDPLRVHAHEQRLAELRASRSRVVRTARERPPHPMRQVRDEDLDALDRPHVRT